MKPEKLEHLCSMHRFQVAQALAVPCMQCYIDRLTAELEIERGVSAAMHQQMEAYRDDADKLYVELSEEDKENAALRKAAEEAHSSMLATIKIMENPKDDVWMWDAAPHLRNRAMVLRAAIAAAKQRQEPLIKEEE